MTIGEKTAKAISGEKMKIEKTAGEESRRDEKTKSSGNEQAGTSRTSGLNKQKPVEPMLCSTRQRRRVIKLGSVMISLNERK